MENLFNKEDKLSPEGLKKISLREIILKYLAYLPLFLLSMAICIGAAVIYIRYTVPKFKATANMLVKGNDDNSVSSSGSNDFISSALFGGKRVNIDNEIEKLRSNTFLSRVVAKNHFNVNYYDDGNIKRSNLYNKCPIIIDDWNIKDSTNKYVFYIKFTSDKGGLISFKNKTFTADFSSFTCDSNIVLNGISFKIKHNAKILPELNHIYVVEWKPIWNTTLEIHGQITVANISNKTTIIQFSILTENPQEGRETLDAIIKEYSIINIEDKNRVAKSTIDFITERLAAVTEELRKVTDDLQNFKEKNSILDIQKEFGFYFDNSYANIKMVDAIDVNIKILNLLDDYIVKGFKENKTIPVPSALGIADFTLNGLIAKYNELEIKHEKDSSQLLRNSMLMQDLNDQLGDLRIKISENINLIRKNYELQKGELKKNSIEYQSKLTSIPQKDIQLQEIARQQTIKQNLYLFLLQKREETEIGSASTVTDYQQIDFAEASIAPVEPRETNIKIFALMLGLFIPLIIIYITDLLNDKLTTRDDIVRKTNIPIVGEISHVDKTMSTIVVGQSRNMIAEQFRILRSNLQFLVNGNKKEDPKIILVTSSISGEGKSFISLNLAAVLSLSDKKVALLEFDLRKMRSTMYQGEKQNNKGITNYLIGQMENPEDIVSSIDKFPTLDIYRSGPIPPNPGELVMGDRVQLFFDWLKTRYDFIVIDSAPVGLVSDSYSLVEHSNNVLYVVRQRYTFKRQIEFVDDIVNQGKLKNVALVVNDVHMGGKYGYYGYGYGYGYGYIYRYGFGYRYGYGYGAYAGKYFKKGADGYFDLPGKKK